MKRFCVVTILFIIIVSSFIIPSFATKLTNYDFQYLPVSDDPITDGFVICNSPYLYKATCANGSVTVFARASSMSNITGSNIYFVSDVQADIFYTNYGQGITESTTSSYHSASGLYYYTGGRINPQYYGEIPVYTGFDEGMSACADFISNNPPHPAYTKNANVDEFIANTLISMGISFNSYSSALPVAQSAWNYLIDDDNWYIGSGDRNDKDIKWDIDNAVSYANAQSNNYLDWYNGYKVNKDLTVALTKFIGDNYTASTLGQGTLAGYSVYYNSSYSYGSSGGSSGFDGTFGSSPNALSFYPASTITYFNGTYLHDNDVIDLDEFVYSPADVRKFIAYPDASGTIISPSDSSGSGVITDGNGDTVYNIDLDFPSLDWLADAIQAVLDFLNRLITTIADFLTQILDAILSLFSDAFESLTEFGQGIIEWLYSVIGNLGTLGSNYIPSDLWTIILPFIYLNVGIAILMFVLRSH